MGEGKFPAIKGELGWGGGIPCGDRWGWGGQGTPEGTACRRGPPGPASGNIVPSGPSKLRAALQAVAGRLP